MLALQRTAGNSATGAILARRRAVARQPNEGKVRGRACQLYERSGGGVRTREEDEADYFEALRQIEIEERAHAIAEQRGGADPVANYYEGERQIGGERKPKPPAEAPKPPVEAPKPVVAEVKPAPVPEAKLQTPKASSPRRTCARASSPWRRSSPRKANLPPGAYDAAQLTKYLRFERKAASDLQLDVPRWHDFDVHVSVHHGRGKFDELHVKVRPRAPRFSVVLFRHDGQAAAEVVVRRHVQQAAARGRL